MKHPFKSLIISIVFLSILFLSNCATPTPYLENLYELGMTAPLITLSYNNPPNMHVTRSCEAIEINYKVNRPIEDFRNHLQPQGKIKCVMNLANILRVQEGLHDSPDIGGMTFALNSLDREGVLRTKLCHSKKDFSSPAEGFTRKSMSTLESSKIIACSPCATSCRLRHPPALFRKAQRAPHMDPCHYGRRRVSAFRK